jgi:cell division septal protein FtsQ
METGSDGSRFTKLQWRRRLRRARPLLITLGSLGVVAVACWVVFFSAWLATDRVDVQGTKHLSDDAVLAAADVDLGEPLARIDIDAVRDRVAEVPAVADVSVHRSWPHTLTIAVSERVPVAMLHQHGWWNMDSEGVTFSKSAHRDPSLPVVDFEGSPDEQARREVATVVESLPASVIDSLKRVHARSMDSIALMLRDNREVVWGSAAESNRKVKVLAILMRQRARVYDVSVPEQPTTMR